MTMMQQQEEEEEATVCMYMESIACPVYKQGDRHVFITSPFSSESQATVKAATG